MRTRTRTTAPAWAARALLTAGLVCGLLVARPALAAPPSGATAGPDWLPTLDHHAAVEPSVATPDTLQRFSVPATAARAYARAYAVGRGDLPGPAHVCLAVPQHDAQGRLLAWAVVVGADAACAEGDAFAAEVAAVRKLAAAAAGRDPVAASRRAHELSRDRFFSVLVAAWSFHKPVLLAHRGLPEYLTATPGPTLCPDAPPAPRALLLLRGGRGAYGTEWSCGGETLRFDPFRAAKLSGDDLAEVDLPRHLAAWKERVAERARSPREAIDGLRAAWTLAGELTWTGGGR
jgi:hypothetical protein